MNNIFAAKKGATQLGGALFVVTGQNYNFISYFINIEDMKYGGILPVTVKKL